MSGTDESPAQVARERRRALLRLAFGSVQIMGASAGLYLLVATGASIPTGIVVGLTLIVTIASRIIFSPAPQPDETAAKANRKA